MGRSKRVISEKEQVMIDRMLDKSQEAFIMAIEIYNRPSIKYRVEGFSFFICNAWELMLKAQIIKVSGYDNLFYTNRNGERRTITLKKALTKTLSNKKSPVTRNLEEIVELRNTSTHFIVEEDNQIYLGLFQASITNYEQYMNKWHERRIANIFPSNYLTLSINAKTYDTKDVLAKYPDDVALALIGRQNHIFENEEISTSKNYSCVIKQELVLTKKASDSSKKVAVVPVTEADEKVAIVERFKDPSKSHPHSVTECISEINNQLKKRGIVLYMGDEIKDRFTSNDFQIFAEQYGYKENPKYCYTHIIGQSQNRTYSQLVIDETVDALARNNKLIGELKELKKKRAAQGAKEF